MRKYVWYLFAAAAAVVLCVVALEARGAAKPASVGADVDTIYQLADGRRVENHGHYYRNAKGQSREESRVGVLITDTTNGTVTLLIPDAKEAHVFKVPQDRQITRDHGKPATTPLGTGTHEGHPISKAKVAGTNGRSHEVWTATDIGLPVYTRTESQGLTTERILRHLDTSEPDSALFGIPGDYKKVMHEHVPAPSGLPTFGQQPGGQR